MNGQVNTEADQMHTLSDAVRAISQPMLEQTIKDLGDLLKDEARTIKDDIGLPLADWANEVVAANTAATGRHEQMVEAVAGLLAQLDAEGMHGEERHVAMTSGIAELHEALAQLSAQSSARLATLGDAQREGYESDRKDHDALAALLGIRFETTGAELQQIQSLEQEQQRELERSVTALTDAIERSRLGLTELNEKAMDRSKALAILLSVNIVLLATVLGLVLSLLLR